MLQSKDSIEVSIARLVLSWAESRSKDPRTKVAACLYDRSSGAMFFGYNGFPRGVDDNDTWFNTGQLEGLTKYDLVIHAEQNALTQALKARVDPVKCCLITSVIPCSQCMKNVIAAHGIKDVYYLKNTFVSFTEAERDKVTSLAQLTNTKMEHVTL